MEVEGAKMWYGGGGIASAAEARESWSHREERERERDRKSHKENAQRLWLGKQKRGWFLWVFTTIWAQRLEFLKSEVWPVWSSMGVAVLLWRRDDSPVEESMVWGFSGTPWERQFPLLGVHVERWNCFSRDKRVSGCHYSQHTCGHLLKVAYLNFGSLLCFTPNLMPLCFGATALLEQNYISASVVRPSSRR